MLSWISRACKVSQRRWKPFPDASLYRAMTHKEAVDLFSSNDLIGIGMEADKVRQKLHPESVVTYAVEGEFDLAHSGNVAAACERAERLRALGASSISLRGMLPSKADVNMLATLVQVLTHAGIGVTGFSPQQCAALAQKGNLPLESTMAQLRDAGLQSINSGPVDTRNEQSAGLWREAHKAAHKAGMKTSARVEFGTGDTATQRLNALESVGRLQDETGGFVSLSVTFREGAAEEPTAIEYLKSLAVARLYLPGILNCENSWRGAGLKVCQLGLRFGSNDLGRIEVIDSAADHRSLTGITAGELRRLIRDAGFLPKERTTDYSAYFLT
jgi:cyclic dehypoxanthinyl futalosine synthase